MRRMIGIVQFGDQWRIVDDDGHRSEPKTFDDALASAQVLARRAKWQGLEAEILVHRDGELRGHALPERGQGQIGQARQAIS